MFTGLIEEVGEVRWMRSSRNRGVQLRIGASLITSNLHPGDSVAVNGCCLTATATRNGQVTFDLLRETIGRTNLRTVRAGSPVNLERALPAHGRLGGHFIQGHVDCATRVLGFDSHDADFRLEVELAPEFAHYAAFKGSIALNGVSLTIAELLPHSLVVWIVPHTRRKTNFASLRVGDLLNVEFDLLAKYLERMLPRIMNETPPKPKRRSSSHDRRSTLSAGRKAAT
ncbi:MAG TPA: riboflavin synthase [Chthoniobacterales bacterium]|jgi:riboflavin synthase